MNMTDQAYQDLVTSMERSSPQLRDGLTAFAVGGAICVVGQILRNSFQNGGMNSESAGTWTTITLIFLSALFTGLNWYDRLAKYAGAGTLVPVTGFANSIVSPAMDFKSEGYITGMAAKMFTIAGPVLVFGIGASVLYGLILCLLK